MIRRTLIGAMIAAAGCTGAPEPQAPVRAEAEWAHAEFLRRNGSRLPFVPSEQDLPQVFSGMPGSADLPPGWRPFRFNGLTFYVVPLN